MQISLGHLLFSVLLSTGAAFKCGECRQDEVITCTPTMKTCDTSEKNCMTMVESGDLGSSPFRLVEMNCTTRQNCMAPFIHLTFGKGRYIRKITTCCETDQCSPPSPTADPPLNSTANGRSCPACSSMTSDCVNNEILNCTGSDTFCFSFSMTNDKKTKQGQMKGCTTESVCTALKIYERPVVGMSFVQDVTCRHSKGSCFVLEFHLLSFMLMTLSLLSLH